MIKFRAWDKENNKYFEPTYQAYMGRLEDLVIGLSGRLQKRTCRGVVDESVFPGRYVVEQFTGLKDVNGKEIYIGDIIKFFGANKKFKSKNEFGIIIYKAARYGAGFNSIIQNKEHGYGGINIAQDIVVGNMHENPELLEADK
ncbi:uncharacterized protein SN35N_2903 [Lactiplantibacillus plantarum]|nr:YopX family protein [Lactiplantibacillus plantarum]BBA83282.1 uncharacterized protein SN35N_2903 [Lactiplantibacillus plantarum]